MQIDPPYQIESCLHHAYGFYLWRIGGEPEVWHRVPYKAPNKSRNEVLPHWEKIGAIDNISRIDAKFEIAAAWKQESEWRSAYAGTEKR